MKILHTADWHLGKRLDRFSRLPEQHQVLAEICEIADREAVDAVVIAGDIFDTFNPPVEAVELFYRTAKRLADQGRRAVVAIAGNHDSPDRVETADPLARECGIILSGYPHSRVAPFQLSDGISVRESQPGFIAIELPGDLPELRLILTPYANEVRMRTSLGFEDREARLREVLQSHWQELADRYCDTSGINLLVTHLFMVPEGSENEADLIEPDDEKSILHVGGAQAVFTGNIPRQIQYTALGHLHRQIRLQAPGGPAAYSGSPLAYSMSEADQRKHVLIVEAMPGQTAALRAVPLSAGRPLLRARFESVDAAVHWLQAHPDALVEITMATDRYIGGADRQRLGEAHQGIVAIIPEINPEQGDARDGGRRIDLSQSMESLFINYFEYRNGQAPDEGLLKIFREVVAGDE